MLISYQVEAAAEQLRLHSLMVTTVADEASLKPTRVSSLIATHCLLAQQKLRKQANKSLEMERRQRAAQHKVKALPRKRWGRAPRFLVSSGKASRRLSTCCGGVLFQVLQGVGSLEHRYQTEALHDEVSMALLGIEDHFQGKGFHSTVHDLIQDSVPGHRPPEACDSAAPNRPKPRLLE